MTKCVLILTLLGLCAVAPARAEILLRPKASEMEVYAAKEFQRYWHQLSGTLLTVTRGERPSPGGEPLCVIGTPTEWPWLGQLAKEGKIPSGAPGAQGYVLKKLEWEGRSVLVIAGADQVGCLYGVYGLLEDHLGCSFHFDGDVLPPQKTANAWPAVEETKTPAVAIRGMLPWTNFPQSPSSYSWEDWQFILDQMAKMRMNFLLIHNYNGEARHNEMFHNFEFNGKLSRVWMPTARTGHGWGARPGWEVNKYLFGASDLFDDYDFGADCALHNDRLDNPQVFRKGVNLFQRVIAQAHRRGIKIGLGLDINLIPEIYGAEPDAPGVIEARAGQVARDYPELDYLFCFQSELIAKDLHERTRWRGMFDRFHQYLKQHAPAIHIGVSGWGLAAEDVATLPPEVICAPIAPYSPSFECGAIYGKREYWGCPWLERDMNSSEYYYPYNIDLSKTIKSWEQRAPNMQGFYCLTWRLADAISPKLGYIARAPWDSQNSLKDSASAYGRFAQQHYGSKAAEAITQIINQNEPFASNFGECEATPPFANKGRSGALFNFSSLEFSGKGVASRLVPAKEAVEHAGIRLAGDSAAWIDAEDWMAFGTNGKFNFDPGWTEVTARVASQDRGGVIEIRLDAVDGPKVGEVLVPVTGGWNQWTNATARIKSTERNHSLYLVFKSRDMQDELSKAESQLAVIDRCIADADTPAQKYRLALLRSRIGAARDHIRLNLSAPETWWLTLGNYESWAGNFVSRVTDISTLGNVVSMQNRFLQKNYQAFLEDLKRNTYLPPVTLSARGTKEGASLSWETDDAGVRGVTVVRNNRVIAELPGDATRFEDKANGSFNYAIRLLRWGDELSHPSAGVKIDAGKADKTPPQIILISPPTSIVAGQPLWVKARLIDGREHQLLSATLCYRPTGQKEWVRLPMVRRTKAVFTATVPSEAIVAEGLQYYVEASDGNNGSVFPASSPTQALSLVVEEKSAQRLAAPQLRVRERTLIWAPVQGASYYRIYRSQNPSLSTGPDTLLTYVAADAGLSFTDNGEDLQARPLSGSWHYRVSAVDRNGFESSASPASVVAW